MSEPCHIELEGIEVILSPTLENQFMGKYHVTLFIFI
jgi:hypothetical protein